MRLRSRTHRLERRLPPRPKLPPEEEDTSGLLEPSLVDWAVSLGCERHLDDRELGTITLRQWIHRLSGHELVLIEEDARRQIAARERAAAAETQTENDP